MPLPAGLPVLKQRVITAVILMAVFCGVLFGAGPQGFAGFVALVVVLGAWEWSSLSEVTTPAKRVAYAGFVIAVLAVSIYVQQQLATSSVGYLRQMMMAACTWWAICLLWVQGYPASTVFWQAPLIRLAMGVFVLVPAWHALTFLRGADQGQWLVLTLIVLVAAADSGAYFSGKAFGKHKLAPKVSPGKTWEGVMGGAVLASVMLAVILLFATNYPLHWSLLLALPIAFVSVLGDLFESMLKRHSGLKDSSNLLPGHGGVLDRVDGLVAAAPVFALGLIMIGWPS